MLKRGLLILFAVLCLGSWADAQRFVSGVTDQLIYLDAVSSTDFTTRLTGLTSWTVYRSRNGGAATAYTTPTITEVSAANMPGVYKFLLDEDMTIDAGDDSQECRLYITHAGMAPVSLRYELYRAKITAGETVTAANGAADADVERVLGITAPATNLADALDETGGSGVELAFQSINVTNPAGTAAAFLSTGGNGSGIVGIGQGTGNGFTFSGGASGGDGGELSRGSATGDDLQLVNGDSALMPKAELTVAVTSVSGADMIINFTGGVQNTNSYKGYLARITDPTAGADGGIAQTTSAIRDYSYNAGTCAIILDQPPTFDLDGINETLEILRPTFIHDDRDRILGRSGFAQASAAAYITLDSGANATNNYYRNYLVYIYEGTGADQVGDIVRYEGATKRAYVRQSWLVVPDATSRYVLLPKPRSL